MNDQSNIREIVLSVQRDAEADYTYGNIAKRSEVSDEWVFAILRCSDGLELDEICNKLQLVRAGMSGARIRKIMQDVTQRGENV